MVFSSLTFIYVFLPIALISYFISTNKLKNLVLLASGLIFYSWGEPIYVIVMIISIIIDYTAGRLIAYYDYSNKLRTLFLIISLSMNIGLLSFFKYSNFFIENINIMFGTSIELPNIVLPIGISFYTFQSMSYTIDLYRRNIKVQKSIIKFSSFVTLFPQIVAGPIVRYSDIDSDIENPKISYSNFSDGILIFIIGLGKKVLLANSIGSLWSTIKDMPLYTIPILTAWIGILAFTFQIYFDFSGYSDMSVGIGKMLGFSFPKNFDYPYMSKSISEFWRRWHMTLGGWFKSYIYISLGGNRKGKFRTILNLFIVWALTGFWHGASWNFVIWGLYFGIIIIVEKLFLSRILDKIPIFISWFYSFILIILGWVIFEFTDIDNIYIYIKSMFGFNNNSLFDNNSLYYLDSYLIIFIICIFSSTNLFSKLYKKIYNKIPIVLDIINPVYILFIMIICTSYIVNQNYNPFLYFRF